MATATITDAFNYKLKSINQLQHALIKIKPEIYNIGISEVLPFRVKFTSINIEPIGLGNTPGIGLQVIGYSNYIL